VSTYTIWKTLKEAGFEWQRDRSWCETGVVERKRKGKVVKVIDPDAAAKKVDRARLHGRGGFGERCSPKTRLDHTRRCRIPERAGSQ